MASDTLVQIQIGGADVAIIGGEVYAVPFPPPSATTWLPKMHLGKIRFIDQASGFILCARGTEPGTQIIVQPPGFAVAVNQWLLTRYGDSADGPVPVEDPSQLETGFYAIREPDTGQYLYRNQAEDPACGPRQWPCSRATVISARSSFACRADCSHPAPQTSHQSALTVLTRHPGRHTHQR
jgi:hypothetical protein